MCELKSSPAPLERAAVNSSDRTLGCEGARLATAMMAQRQSAESLALSGAVTYRPARGTFG
jgi:hypothetical protein